MALSTGEFLRKVNGLRSHHAADAVIEVAEPIRVSPGSLPDGLRLSNYHFRERLKLRGVRFENDVVISDCSFDKGLDISGSHCDARFRIRRCRFGSKKELSTDDPLLDFRFVQFQSDVEIAGVESWGAIVGRACRVAGEMVLVSAAISARGDDNPALDLSHARINGRLLLHDSKSRWIREDEVEPISGDRSLPRCSNDRPTTLRSDAANRVAGDFRKMQVHGLVSLSHIHCVGSVDCTFGSFGNLSAHVAEIAGSLTLSGATLGYFHAYGIAISETLTMIAGTSGQIDIDSYFDTGRTEFAEIGALVCSGWQCTHWARFGIRSLGRDNPDNPPFGRRGIQLIGCRIAGDLDFLSGVNPMRYFETVRRKLEPDSTLHLHCNPYLRGLITHDPIVITGCSIGGHLDLTNVRTSDTIDLSDCLVANSIRFSSPLSARAAKAGKDEMHKALILLCCAMHRDDLDEPYQRMMTATARRLHLERTSAGAVDLTGLELKVIGSEDGSVLANHVSVTREFQSARRGTVDEHHHFIEGLTSLSMRPRDDVVADLLANTLRLCLREPVAAKCLAGDSATSVYMEHAGIGAKQVDPPMARAVIPGALRLGNAKIGLLRLSHECFVPQPGRVEQKGIMLDDATIGILRIYRPRPGGAVSGNGFPRPISLRGVKVRSWRLGGRGQPGGEGERPGPLETANDETMESSESEPYLDLLDNDEEYRASTYLSVERSLRDRGHVDAANEVFIAGRFRGLRANLGNDDRNAWLATQGRLQPPLTRLGHKRRPESHRMFFRLKRSSRETFESLAVLVLVSVMVLAGVILSRIAYGVIPFYPPAFRLLVVFLLGSLIVGFSLFLIGPARDQLDRFFDRAFWSLVDYGTSAWRLLGVILLLMAATFFLVARDVQNFEPSPVAFLAEHQEIDLARQPETERFLVPCSEENPVWGMGEGFWMMLRYHIPIVSLAVMEKCMPTDEPIYLAGRHFKGLESRDWFGIMAILNYMLWPLFIPFLIRKFWREERRG